MMTRRFQGSFAGGEVSPEFLGRLSDAKFQSGVATMRNFIPLPHGPAVNRAGFQFVRAARYSDRVCRLIPFTYSSTQTLVLELGEGYMRFHTAGATLLGPDTASAWATATAYVIGDFVSSGGVIWYCMVDHTSSGVTIATDASAGKWHAQPSTLEFEVAMPFAAADLFDVRYAQSYDVMTLVHPDYAPIELRRRDSLDWEVIEITVGPILSAPTGVGAAATVGSGSTAYVYVVTAFDVDESYASTSASVNNNLLTSGNYNTITWSAVTGAVRYRIYKQENGLFGYIGETDALTFKDENIDPDVSITPPLEKDPFTLGGFQNNPTTVSYFEQRRVFAGMKLQPQNLVMTRTGTESNFSSSLPVRDDDAIAIRIASREANTIQHVVPLGELLILTGSAEWQVTSVNSDAITPSSIAVKPQSYIGANRVQPAVVNNSMIYAAARGGHVREMGYNWQSGGYITGDLSLRATHLFDTYTISDMAYTKAPWPLVWFVSSTGNLLSLTYIPEQQIGAWAQHNTDGTFESVCAVAEGEEDRVYAVVNRTIGGQTVRYIERMASRQFVAAEDAVFLDSSLTYDGAAATTISGLDHLEGETVSILSDGAVHPQQVVASGQITLDSAASVVQVGLPITADVETLPFAMQVDNSFGQGRAKNINQAWLRVYRSSGIFAGPDSTRLVEYKQRTTEAYGSPPALTSDEISIVLTPSWAQNGSLFIRQSDPLPLTLVSVSMEVQLGG